jgi:uncharacterized oxidoreductase
MKLSGNTILITGGTSGIGFELATRLVVLGNTVVVTGKNQSHLDAIRHKLPAICAIQGDVSDPAVIASLCQQVVEGFPELNILINNAGIMRKVNLHTFGSDLQDVTREAEINLNGAIRMVLQFLLHLKSQKNAAIIDVSSGLPISPVYCAAKAAVSFLHSIAPYSVKEYEHHRI